MRGRILGFDLRTNDGQISGEDGQRYPFTGQEWKQRVPPRQGQTVDFEIGDGRALSIYSLGGGNPLEGDKNKIVAALLAFFLGAFGVHKFYLGRTGAGLTMLICGTIGWLLFLPGLIVCVIALIEFIIYLVTPDDEFERRYVEEKRAWF